jgi:hypothetical protein
MGVPIGPSNAGAGNAGGACGGIPGAGRLTIGKFTGGGGGQGASKLGRADTY